jgi:hypothetical protein
MAALQPGLNEIRISVMDEGGWAGLNYKLTLTGDAATPPSTIPAGTVPDTTPPVLTVPDPITVACSAAEGISSSNPLIQAWLGQATATDAQDGSVAVLNNAPTTCVLGDNMVTFEAYDTAGNRSTGTTIITVTDTTAPVIGSVTVAPIGVWPPNHKMVAATVSVDFADACDPNSTCRIIAVSSNEALNAAGDGNTASDWQITGALTVDLRAERSGAGTDRVYTITVACTDGAGNTSTRTVTVTVPHDQAKR